MSERVEELGRIVARALEPLRDVRLAYLFGSQVRGAARADSDLDLAVRIRTSDATHRAELLLAVIDARTQALGALGERVDVLDLDRAGSDVAFRVIRVGGRIRGLRPRKIPRNTSSIRPDFSVGALATALRHTVTDRLVLRRALS